MLLTVRGEPRSSHKGHDYTSCDKRNPCKTGYPTVIAEVVTTKPPDFFTFAGAAAGGLGLGKAVVDLGAGWIQALAKPSGSAVLKVTTHAKLPDCAARTRAHAAC